MCMFLAFPPSKFPNFRIQVEGSRTVGPGIVGIRGERGQELDGGGSFRRLFLNRMGRKGQHQNQNNSNDADTYGGGDDGDEDDDNDDDDDGDDDE